MSMILREQYALDLVVSVYGPRVRPVLECPAGLTRQSMAAECDINNIVSRYEKTGMISHVDARSGVFADVSEVGDYREAIDRVRKAEEWFMRLPAKVRAEFKNDPAEFLDYVVKPENRADLEARGILEKAPGDAGGAPPAEGVPGTPEGVVRGS